MPETANHRRRFSPLVIAALILIPAAAIQLWIVGTGARWYWAPVSRRYAHLADGFLHGHLSLPDKPSPRLLALPNPYDPVANAAYRLHDAVLFKGKYYLYWGPVPALIVAAFCLPFGISHPEIGDAWLAYGFTVGTVVLVTLLIFAIRRRLFPDQPPATATWPILSLALGVPLLYTISRALVYEAAIIGGQFFLLAGILSAYVAFGSQRRKTVLFLIAGMCWALGAGSRLSLAPAVAFVSLATIVELRHTSAKASTNAILAIMVPLIVGAVLFAEYNFLRFHHASEFGLRYQVTARDLHALASSRIASPNNVIPDLLVYLFAPPNVYASFPCITAASSDWIRRIYPVQQDFTIEPMVGLLFSQPFILLAPFALMRPKFNDSSATWLVATLAIAAVCGFAPTLLMPGNTMRYLVDLVPCATVLAAIGYWRLLERLQSRPRAAASARWIIGLLVTAQCVMGISVDLARPRISRLFTAAAPASQT